MKDILKKLKLIDNMTTTLRIGKADFVNGLHSITDQGSTGLFSNAFDAFSSSKNEFKGQINYDSFKLKRKRRFFDSNMNMAVASGIFSEKNGELIIETEINGFNNFFIFYYAFLIIIYSIAISGPGRESKAGFPLIPFLFLHAAFMFAVPYFIMRRSVKRLKHELEREFFYLTKKDN